MNVAAAYLHVEKCLKHTPSLHVCGGNSAPSAAREPTHAANLLNFQLRFQSAVKMCRIARTREFCFPKTSSFECRPGRCIYVRTYTHEQINTVGHSHRCRILANLFSWRVLLLAFLRIFAMRKHKAFELIWFKWVKGEFSRSVNGPVRCAQIQAYLL